VHRAGTIPERVITLPLSLPRDEPLFTQSGRTYGRLIELIETACTPTNRRGLPRGTFSPHARIERVNDGEVVSPKASASDPRFISRGFETYCSSSVKSENVLPKCC
jgi:hypothetical protein